MLSPPLTRCFPLRPHGYPLLSLPQNNLVTDTTHPLLTLETIPPFQKDLCNTSKHITLLFKASVASHCPGRTPTFLNTATVPLGAGSCLETIQCPPLQRTSPLKCTQCTPLRKHYSILFSRQHCEARTTSIIPILQIRKLSRKAIWNLFTVVQI